MHELTITLGPERSNGILLFHAFTGCDIVSSFSGKGKKSAWQTWDVCPEASDVFTKLSSYPTHVEKEDIERLEKFVVRMYDRSSSTEAVDDARFELFVFWLFRFRRRLLTTLHILLAPASRKTLYI